MIRYALGMIMSLMLATSAIAAPTAGAAAPEFKATDALSGKQISLADFKGKTVVLEWNNFGCPFVHKFYDSGTMQKLQEHYTKEGVVWITINSSAEGKEGYLADATAAKKAVAEHQGNSSYYILDHDGSIGHRYDAKTTPNMFVIDKDGKIAYMGAIDSIPTADTADIPKATNYVAATIEALKKGEVMNPQSTRPYGCFVKY
jgi:peroxiredoxin